MRGQSFMTVLRDVMVLGPGFSFRIDMNCGIGEVLQVVEQFMPVLFCNRMSFLHRQV